MNYPVDENLRRQELLADVFEAPTRDVLAHLSLPSKSEVLDVGCGIGRTTDLLSGYIPDPKRVVGLDADETLLNVARDQRGEETSAGLKFQKGDATHLPFQDNSFDLVFTRFLLTHLPEPSPAVKEFRRVCRPGGTVLVQEPDCASTFAWPPSTVYEKLPELAATIMDTQMGRKTLGLLQDSGIRETEVQAVVPVETKGTAMRELMTLSIQAIGGALLEEGHIEEQEYEQLLAEARRVEDDPNRLVGVYTVFSAWGTV